MTEGEPTPRLDARAGAEEIRARVIEGDEQGALVLASRAVAEAVVEENPSALDRLAGELYAIASGVDGDSGDELRAIAGRAEAEAVRARDEASRWHEEDDGQGLLALPSAVQAPGVPPLPVRRAFVPLENRASLAVGALSLAIFSALYGLWLDRAQLTAIDDFVGGNVAALLEIERLDDRRAIRSLVGLAVMLAIAVPFLSWFRAAYRNLEPLRCLPLRFGPGWAIGGWFVPVLNLWRPKQIANDIWRRTDPGLGDLLGDPRWSPTVGGIVTAWWATWLVSRIVQSVGIRFASGGDTTAQIKTGVAVHSLGLVLEIASAVLAMAVVLQVTRRQRRRLAALDAAAAGTS